MKYTRKEFDKTLTVSVVGLKTAERNRKKYIRQLGDIYHEFAGKLGLYNMFEIKKTRKGGNYGH